MAILATLAPSRTTSLLHGPITAGSVLAARVSGFQLAFMAAAVLLGAAWTVAALQLRARRAREPKLLDVPRDLAAARWGAHTARPWGSSAQTDASPAAPMTPPRRVIRDKHQRRWIPAAVVNDRPPADEASPHTNSTPLTTPALTRSRAGVSTVTENSRWADSKSPGPRTAELPMSGHQT